MALSAATVWEVRTTGSDANGAGFVTGASGTDYSQQNAAQWSGSDGIGSNANSNFQSVGAGFTSAAVGNLMYITTGTNFTPGYYQITAFVDTDNLTLDRTPASGVSATDAVWAIGGAAATPGIVFGSAVANNTVWIAPGTYTCSSSSNVAGGRLTIAVNYLQVFGYVSSRTPITQPTTSAPYLKAGANSVTILSTSGANGWAVNGVNFDGDKAARTGTIAINVGNQGNVRNGIIENSAGVNIGGGGAIVTRCIVRNSGSNGVDNAPSVSGCIISGNTGAGVRVSRYVEGNLIHSNGGSGLAYSSLGTIRRNRIVGNTGSGILMVDGNAAAVEENIIYGNSAWGISGASMTSGHCYAEKNFIGGNTSGAVTGSRVQEIGTTTLSGDPFVNSASDDYEINPASVGGAQIRSAGVGITDGTNDVPGTYEPGDFQIAPASSSVIVIDD